MSKDLSESTSGQRKIAKATEFSACKTGMDRISYNLFTVESSCEHKAAVF